MDANHLAQSVMRAGWVPVKLAPRGKNPVAQGWQNERPEDWSVARCEGEFDPGEAWNVGMFHPDAVVLDVDDPAALYALMDDLDAEEPGASATLARAPYVETRRGWHVFLTAPEPMSGCTLREGVEVKSGAGGQQVAAPGCIIDHEDGTHEPRRGNIPYRPDLPMMPEALKSRVRATRSGITWNDADYEDTKDGIEGFRAMLLEDAQYGLVHEGEATTSAFSGEPITGRDNLIFAAASLSHDFGLERGTAYDLMTGNLGACGADDEASSWLEARIAPGDTDPKDADTVAAKLNRRRINKQNAPGWRAEAHPERTADESFGDVAVPAGEKPKSKSGIVKLIRLDDEVIPPEFLIENTLVEGALNMIHGQYGTFKTFVALDMALSVASGVPWHDRAVKQKPVLYIAGESHTGVWARANAWMQYHGIDMHHDFVLTPTMPPVSGGRYSAELREWAEAVETEWGEPGMIVMDTQHSMMKGMNLNDDQDAGTFLAAVRDGLMARWDATGLLIHHPPKTQATDPQAIEPRGSNAVPGHADAIYYVRSDNPLETSLYQQKMREGEAWPADAPLTFMMDKFDGNLVPQLAHPEHKPEENRAMAAEEQDRRDEEEDAARERRLAEIVGDILASNVDENGDYLPMSKEELQKAVKNPKTNLTYIDTSPKGVDELLGQAPRDMTAELARFKDRQKSKGKKGGKTTPGWRYVEHTFASVAADSHDPNDPAMPV